MVCPYAILGCTASCRRADLPSHLAACAYRLGSLQSLNSNGGHASNATTTTGSSTMPPPLYSGASGNNTATIKEQYEVVCPYTVLGCRATFLRSDLHAHLGVCAFRPRSRQEEEDERQVNRKYAIEAEETERMRRAASITSFSNNQQHQHPPSLAPSSTSSPPQLASYPSSSSSSYAVTTTVRSALLESILHLQQQPPQLQHSQASVATAAAATNAASSQNPLNAADAGRGERTRRLSLLVQAAEIERMRRNEEQFALISRKNSASIASATTTTTAPPPLPSSPLARASLEETLRRGRVHRQSFPEEAVLGRRTHANSFHDHLEHQTKVCC